MCLNEFVFLNFSSENIFNFWVIVSGGVKDLGGWFVEDYIRDFIVGYFFEKSMVEERKIVIKYFLRDEIVVSEILVFKDYEIFKDFEKLFESDYFKVMVILVI